MKTIIMLVVLMVFVAPSYSQQRFENADFGFAIDMPKDWHLIKDEEALRYIQNKNNTDVSARKLMRGRPGYMHLISFYKYDNDSTVLNPMISIQVRDRSTENKEDFGSISLENMGWVSTVFPEHNCKTSQNVITVYRYNAVQSSSQYTGKTNVGDTVKLNFKTFAVIRPKYVYRISLFNGVDTENCAAFIDALLQTMRLKE